MMSMIQQKKLTVAGLWSRKRQDEVQFRWLCFPNIRISCDIFFCYGWPTFELFFCATFVISKPIRCLIGKDRGKQNTLYLHISFWKHKLQTWKMYNYSSLMQSCIGNAINKRNGSPTPFTCEIIFEVFFKLDVSWKDLVFIYSVTIKKIMSDKN